MRQARLESERFAEQASAEWDAEKAWWKHRVDTLQKELENVKLMQYEDRQQLLREHSEVRRIAVAAYLAITKPKSTSQVVKALQVHFEEYRSTAEALFAAEAAKLEDKLAVQSRKYVGRCSCCLPPAAQHLG